MKVREAIRRVERDGWVQQKGKATRHRQFKHPDKKGKVTISGNPGDELRTRDEDSIRTQAQIEKANW